MTETHIDIVETSEFAKKSRKIFTENELEELFQYLLDYPANGVVIPGSGGLRKMRWSSNGKGKRGGSRIIYYYHKGNEIILLLTAYPKNEQENLSERDKKYLKILVEQFVEEWS